RGAPGRAGGAGPLTPIIVTCRPLEATRTANSPCSWIAEATIEGQTYTARARHGAPNELPRQLVATRSSDRPIVIRYRALAGRLTYRSFHAAATWTYSEGNQPLRRVRYKQPPEGVFLGSGARQKCVSSPVAGDVEIPPADGHETEAPAPTAEMRRC